MAGDAGGSSLTGLPLSVHQGSGFEVLGVAVLVSVDAPVLRCVPLVLVLPQVGSCRQYIQPVSPLGGVAKLHLLHIVRWYGNFRGTRARALIKVGGRIDVLLLCPPPGQAPDGEGGRVAGGHTRGDIGGACC